LRLVGVLNPLTDSEDVAIRVTHVHLADAPWHIGRRPGDVEILLQALPMDGVDIVHPDRHPDANVGGFVAVGTEVIFTPPLPRPPWAPWHKKISHSPEQTPPKVGGSPHSQPFFQPSFSNQPKLSAMSDTFKIGVSLLASMLITPQARGATHYHP
jgi:hypothetical protein